MTRFTSFNVWLRTEGHQVILSAWDARVVQPTCLWQTADLQPRNVPLKARELVDRLMGQWG